MFTHGSSGCVAVPIPLRSLNQRNQPCSSRHRTLPECHNSEIQQILLSLPPKLKHSHKRQLVNNYSLKKHAPATKPTKTARCTLFESPRVAQTREKICLIASATGNRVTIFPIADHIPSRRPYSQSVLMPSGR